MVSVNCATDWGCQRRRDTRTLRPAGSCIDNRASSSLARKSTSSYAASDFGPSLSERSSITVKKLART